MAIDYNLLLSVDQKRAIVQQRLSEFAAQAYQHSLNKETCEKLNDVEGIESAVKALEILNAAIEVHQNELDSLPALIAE